MKQKYSKALFPVTLAVTLGDNNQITSNMYMKL